MASVYAAMLPGTASLGSLRPRSTARPGSLPPCPTLRPVELLSWDGRRSCTDSLTVVTRQAGGATAVDEASPPAHGEPLQAIAAVDRVLQLIEDTDSGDRATPAQRAEIDSLLNELEVVGQGQEPRPLDSPLIYGNYNVAYVSTGKGQQGQPAGGRFRSGIGKLLFGTTVLAQSVLQPDVVTNKLEFALLGLLPGAVGLRGKLVGIPEKQGGPDNKDTVKVFFDPPVISLPGGIHTRIGGPSTVVLTTTYLDDRVRLGRGSRGSLFVFTRGGKADQAGMSRVGLERTSPLGLLLLITALSGMIAGGALAATRAALPAPVRAAGAAGALLGAALAASFWRGGQLDDNTDREEVQPPEAGGAQPQASEAKR